MDKTEVKRKVWFIPTGNQEYASGYLSKTFFFEIKHNMIHNPGRYCLVCKEMKIGVVNLFSKDMSSAKEEAFAFLKQAAKDKRYPASLFYFIDKYEI